MQRFRTLAAIFLLALPCSLAGAQVSNDVIEKIKDEGLNRSQVMQTLSYLSDVIGPRLTASPGAKRANEWTKDQLTKWGCYNAHLEPWGPFGRGWTLKRFSAQVVEPVCIPLIAYPKAWSPGLKKPIVGDVVYVDARTEEDLQKYKGKLKGAIVLDGPIRPVAARFTSQGSRWTDQQLADMAAATNAGGQRPRPNRVPQAGPGGAPGAPTAGGVGGGRGGAGGGQGGAFATQFQMAGKKAQFYMDEGVALVMDAARGDGGTIFVQSATVPTPPGQAAGPGGRRQAAGGSPQAAGGPAAGAPTAGQPAGGRQAAAGQGGGQPGFRRISPYSKDAPKMLPQVAVAVEHYNRMARMLEAGEKVKLAVDLAVEYQDKDLMSYNTVAEIPGTDLKDQIVMVGAHMDSWHSGTGATDNGAGCAVGMEVMRILKALNLQPRRTIRIGLWTGEEEGLLGSRAYVTEHLGNVTGGGGFGGGGGGAAGGEPPQLTTKPEYEKFSGYFNLDNGTGKIRGIYLQGNAGCKEIFQKWLEPFKDMGASTVTISNTGGTDHQSFDRIGLPGFQFIQDEVEYETRTHHSNQDVFDRIQADDMKQAAVIMATFVYSTAMRDEMLPRKPKPGTN